MAMESPFIASLSRQVSKYDLQVIEGFEQQLLKKFPEAEFGRYFLQKQPQENSRVLQTIKEQEPFLLLTLGSQATHDGLHSIPDVPLVAAMILNEQVLAGSTRATGVLLRFPFEIHIQWLRRFFPDVDHVNMLYNPLENSKRIDEMIKTAEKSDIAIEAIPVKSVTALPAALKSLGRKVGLLLGLPDQTVYSGKTAKAVLLSTFRNRIPFAGLSSSWVKAGALYALTRDYKDIGRQCGLIAEKILTGTPVAAIAPVTPDKVLYEINMKTADHLRLTLDPALIQEATEVYR